MKILPILMSLAGVLFSTGEAAEVPSILLRERAVGEIVEADIVAPVAVDVFQPDQTEALRHHEWPKVPPIFRENPSSVSAADTELRSRFNAAREQFVAVIEGRFGRRTLQAEAELSDQRFFEAMTVLRAGNPGFPLSTNLAELWALGDAGTVVLDDLANQLRRFMAAHIRPDRLPEDEQLTAPSIVLLPADAPTDDGTAASSRVGTGVTSRGVSIPGERVFALTQYRHDLIALAPASDKSAIRFLAELVFPTCIFDAKATRSARARRLQDLNVVDRLEAGAIVARQGERVDARLKRSLDALRARQQAVTATGSATQLQAELERARTDASRLQLTVESDRLQAARALLAVRQDAATAERRSRLLRWGVGGVSGVCVIFIALWWRHRRRQRQLERSENWAVIPAGLTGDEADLWRERAMAAEARAAKATALLRTRLLPHMARWMMTELVQRLLLQRSTEQTSQQRAEIEVAELAERLERLHAPLAERRRAYEQRIRELEAELAARDRQDHALIQARIESTRRRLQADQTEAAAPFAS